MGTVRAQRGQHEIPGTSPVAHLRENVAGAGLVLTGDDLAVLDRIGPSHPAQA